MSIDDLPESYRVVARVIGIDGAIKLSKELGGLSFYFPKIGALIQKRRDEEIRKEFNGANYIELAMKYSLSEIWIRRIVAGTNKKHT
jgi:Mor family transcriptional regulator